MSIIHCKYCDMIVDTDFCVEHEDECEFNPNNDICEKVALTYIAIDGMSAILIDEDRNLEFDAETLGDLQVVRTKLDKIIEKYKLLNKKPCQIKK